MPTVSEISSRYVDEVAALDPVRGERWGVAADPTRLTDYSPASYQALADLLRRTRQDLEAATPQDEPERLGQGFLIDWVTGELGIIDAGEREENLSIIVGAPASTRSVFDLMDRSTPEAWEHIAARLEAVAGAMAGYRATLQAGLDRGHPAARRQAIAVADQCSIWAGDGTNGGWFGAFVAGYGDGPRRPTLDAAARKAAAAYGDLAAWLRGDYAAYATETDGCGEERYRIWSEYLLGTDLDIDEAYAWGWDELARLEAQKDVECERILPGGGFEAVRNLLINDPNRCIAGVDAYREWLQYLTDEAISGLSGKEFDIPPSIARCEVRIPPEGSAAAAYYTSPSEDLTRPGRTWFPTVGRTRFPTWDDVSTVYHEAVPGHHLQGATIRLVPLTRAHKLGFNSAHGEGWALYAERLMDELGWFRTPETRLGFLCAHAFRAARVVVDIGLHTGRRIPAGWPGSGEQWTYDGAIDFIVRAGGMDRDKAESEVLRYLSWPSQATAYKLGERTWLTGREKARSAAAASGRAFDQKGWHARSLALGPLGLRRLEVELAKA
ncbi:MAG: DUF885 domain-containing protein [Chloroflexi bacterium]|nr:DUF885 domain-containing protein [Chloroflexota bacterium]